MTYLLAFLCIVLGCGLLSLSYRRHFRRLLSSIEQTSLIRWMLRLSGTVALAAGLALCLRVDSTGIALTLFFALLTPAVCTVALLLSLHRHRLNQTLHLQRRKN